MKTKIINRFMPRKRHSLISVSLMIVLFSLIISVKAETQLYTLRTEFLEFEFEVPVAVRINQTFQVKVTVTNKAPETVYLKLTWIDLHYQRIYISRSTDGDPYPPDSVIFQSYYTFTVDNFSYLKPVIWVNMIAWNCYTSRGLDYGTTGFAMFIETDYRENYNTLKSDFDVLKNSYDSLQLEIGNLRYQLYIFVATTIVFIATAVYFAKRKPKTT